MDSQFLLDALIELTPHQLLENDGIPADGTLLLPSSNPPIVSNQTMVDLGKKLLQAASENDIENVKALMTGGAPFTGNWLGTTPLHAAAKAGHIETVELLLKAGIFRDAKTKVDRTALQMAAEEGHTAIVRMLIEHSADVNAKDMLKMTALHWAVERCHLGTVEVLLEHGADVMALNKFDKSPIDIAYDNGFDGILQLLETAADPTVSTETLVESQAAAEKLMNELAATDKIAWKHSPEEEALETLTANTIGNVSFTNEATKLLESHGITMLPVDNSTLLTSALESGQTISLTEAGKLALDETKQPTTVAKTNDTFSPAKKLKLSAGCSLNLSVKNGFGGIQNSRVVTMSAEQFIALATAGKLHPVRSNKPMVITLPPQTSNNGGKKTSHVSGIPIIPPSTNIPPKTTITTVSKHDLVTSLAQILSGQSTSAKNITANSAKMVNSESNRILAKDVDKSGIKLKTAKVLFATNSVPKIESGSIHPAKVIQAVSNINSMKPADNVQSAQTPAIIEAPATTTVVTKSCERSNEPSEVEALDREHFLKSGLLKGSARTTPITLLCRKGKSVSSDECGFSSPNVDEVCRKPLLSNVDSIADNLRQVPPPSVALNADLCLNDGIFNEDSGEDNSSNAVWLSIMEEENSQFVSGNDEDLLDPTRLAAQLASIKQAASRFSFSN